MSKYLLALLISLTTSGVFAHNCGGIRKIQTKKLKKRLKINLQKQQKFNTNN